MARAAGLLNGEVSCRVTEYVIQHFEQNGFQTAPLIHGLEYTLDELRTAAASISWDDYLTFFRNTYSILTPAQILNLSTFYNRSPSLRPFFSAAASRQPARYFEMAADPRTGPLAQLFRCIEPSFKQINSREVELGLQLRDGYTLPPDMFWQSQAIGFSAATTHLGLSPALVTWKPVDRGALYQIRLPAFRPLKFLVGWIANWFRKDVVEDVFSALAYGHERSLQLELEIEERRRVETQLREQNALLNKLSDQIPGLLYQFQQWPDGRSCLPYASRGIQELYGFTHEEVHDSARKVIERLHPEDFDGVMEGIRRSRDLLETWRCEHRVNLPQRGLRWLEGHSVPERMSDGSTLWHGFIQDVTDRKRIEESLRLSEERWKFALEGSGAGVLDWDIPSDRMFFSERWREITGYADGDFSETGLGLKALVHPDDLPHAISDLEATLEGRQSLHHIEHRVKRKDGTWVWIESRSIVTSRGSDGAPLRMIGTHTDISDRKLAEQSLRASEERFRAFMQHSPILAWIVSDEGQFLFANDNFRSSLGLVSEEVLGKRILDLFSPELAAEYLENNRRVFEWGVPQQMEERVAWPDGSIGLHLSYKFPLPTAGSSRQLGGLAWDITEQRQAEAALKESEARYRRAERGTNDGLWDWNIVTGENYMSPRLLELLGFSVGDLPHRIETFQELLHPEDRERVFNAIDLHLNSNELYSIEMRLRCKGGNFLWVQSRGVAERNEAGTALRMAGSITDISERRRVEGALRESENRLKQAIRVAQIGIFDHDQLSDSVYWSPELRIIHGWSDEDAVTLSDYLQIIHPEDRERISQEILRAHDPSGNGLFDIEYRIKRRINGEVRWIATRSQTYFTGEGASRRPTRTVGAVLDYTHLKRTENSLRESENQLAEAQRIARIGSWSWDPASNTVWWSNALYELIGIPRESFQPSFDKFLQLLHPLDRPTAIHRVEAMLAGADEFADDLRIIRPDGVIIWIHSRARATRDMEGNIVRVDGTDQDITDRKKAELALKASELRYRTLIETSSDAIFQVDMTGRIISANSTAAKMHGYSMEELLSMKMQDLDVPDDAAVFFDRLKRLQKRESLTFQVWHYRKDGSTFPLEVIASAEELDGEWFVLAFDRDITERKRAEEELRKSEERLRMALSAATAVAFTWNVQTDSVIRYFSNEPALPTNILVPEPVAAVREMIHPDDLDTFDAGVNACQAESSDYRNLYRVIRPDGSIRWLEEWGTMSYDASGNPLDLTGISIDVTDRKEAELALLEEKQLLQAVFESLPGVAFAFDQAGRFLRWNRNYEKLLGWTDEDVRGMTAIETVTMRDRERVAAAIQEAFVNGQASAEFYAETKCRHKIPLYCSAVRVTLRGEPCLVGFGIDISDRLAAESELKARESQLRAFIENAPVGVAMFDRDMRYLSYSRRWLSDFDLNDQHLVGQSHYEVFPATKDDWKAIYAHCLAGNSQQCDEDQFVHAGGRTEYSRWEIQPWYEASGDVGGIILFAESITERVIAEERLRASLREKEAMLKEIHHRVKNNLQVISSLLSLQSLRPIHPDANEVLTESQNRIRAMALVHETLYRSDDFAHVDLSQYLKELCGYLSRAYGVDGANIQVIYDVQPVNLSLDKSITCGLLVNELVSNALKHAFPRSTAGTVTIVLRETSDGRVELRIVDNGVGLSADFDISQSASLGLQLVNILTEQLCGRLTIDRDNGTSIELSFLR